MFFLSKLLGYFASPMGVALLLMLGACIFAWFRPSRFWMRLLTLLCFGWFVFWSLPSTVLWIGGALERGYPPVPVAGQPKADAIVILGGSMASPKGGMAVPELHGSADRVWHAARLYRAGKADKIIFSGIGEGPGARQFLRDLNVRADDILLEDKSRNTVENIRNIKALLDEKKFKRILLVTSATHMRRAMRTCELAGIDAIPAAADHEILTRREYIKTGNSLSWLPSVDCFLTSNVIAKEYIGLWAMKLKLHGRP